MVQNNEEFCVYFLTNVNNSIKSLIRIEIESELESARGELPAFPFLKWDAFFFSIFQLNLSTVIQYLYKYNNTFNKIMDFNFWMFLLSLVKHLYLLLIKDILIFQEKNSQSKEQTNSNDAKPAETPTTKQNQQKFQPFIYQTSSPLLSP